MGWSRESACSASLGLTYDRWKDGVIHMTTQDWIAIGTSAATLLGVLASGFAIWFQLRSVSRQVKLQNFAEFTRRYRDIVQHVPEIFDDQTTIASLPNPQRGLQHLREYFDLCFEEHLLYRTGWIDRAAWSIWSRGMQVAFARPLIIEAWNVVEDSSYFDHEFREYVGSELLRQGRPHLGKPVVVSNP